MCLVHHIFVFFYHIILNLCFIHRQSYTLSSFIFMYYVLKPVGEALLLKKQNWDVHNFDKNQAEMLDGSILRTKWMTRLSFDQNNSFSLLSSRDKMKNRVRPCMVAYIYIYHWRKIYSIYFQLTKSPLKLKEHSFVDF